MGDNPQNEGYKKAMQAKVRSAFGKVSLKKLIPKGRQAIIDRRDEFFKNEQIDNFGTIDRIVGDWNNDAYNIMKRIVANDKIKFKELQAIYEGITEQEQKNLFLMEGGADIKEESDEIKKQAEKMEESKTNYELLLKLKTRGDLNRNFREFKDYTRALRKAQLYIDEKKLEPLDSISETFFKGGKAQTSGDVKFEQEEASGKEKEADEEETKAKAEAEEQLEKDIKTEATAGKRGEEKKEEEKKEEEAEIPDVQPDTSSADSGPSGPSTTSGSSSSSSESNAPPQPTETKEKKGDGKKQRISMSSQNEFPSSIDNIPQTRLSSNFKNKAELIGDIKYFYSNFESALTNIIKKNKNLGRLTTAELQRLHKRIVATLNPTSSKKGGRVGVVIDAEEYIKSVMNQAMIDKAIENFKLPNLEPLGELKTDDNETPDGANSYGSYEVKRGPDGGLNSQNEPVYRYIPTTQPEQIEEDKYNYKRRNSRVELPKSKLRTQVTTAKRQLEINPFINKQGGHRVNILL